MCMCYQENEPRTWAFVEYNDPDPVQSAIDHTSGGVDIGGVEVTVQERKSEPKLFR